MKEELLKGNLDLALISSVECIRNSDVLDFSLSTGVCSSNRVRSILYFENKFHKETKIHVDEGSRSSVALLKILFYQIDQISNYLDHRLDTYKFRLYPDLLTVYLNLLHH